MTRRWIVHAITLVLAAQGLVSAQTGRGTEKMATVLLENSSPLVTFRILFNVGSASDPAGKEGVASLTADMLAKGGSKSMSYDRIIQAMYPMATQFNSQVDKEMTVFYGTTHIDNLQKYYQIIAGMLLDPGWRDEDFNRVKVDAINYLKVNLRGNNDEELGKEALYNFIYQGHPYGHNNTGSIESLEKLTLDDLKSFYRENYTQANLVLGLAGGYPPDFPAKVGSDFSSKLPVGTHKKPRLPEPEKIQGLEMMVIEKEARGDAISFGFPIDVNRASADWPALLVAQTYFGQHRSGNSYLYQRIRAIRGMNYGDYAYIEYFPSGMFQFRPDPNLCRGQQIFQVWIRPVEPQNGVFALRIGLYELRKLTTQGISREAFESTRRFLMKNVSSLIKTQDAQLGYAIDSRYYGIKPYADFLREELTKISLEDVNRAIKKYLQSDNIKIVVVAKDAEAFKAATLDNKPSAINYSAPVSGAILEEDKKISNYKLVFNPKKVEVVPVERVFQK